MSIKTPPPRRQHRLNDDTWSDICLYLEYWDIRSLAWTSRTMLTRMESNGVWEWMIERDFGSSVLRPCVTLGWYPAGGFAAATPRQMLRCYFHLARAMPAVGRRVGEPYAHADPVVNPVASLHLSDRWWMNAVELHRGSSSLARTFRQLERFVDGVDPSGSLAYFASHSATFRSAINPRRPHSPTRTGDPSVLRRQDKQALETQYYTPLAALILIEQRFYMELKNLALRSVVVVVLVLTSWSLYYVPLLAYLVEWIFASTMTLSRAMQNFLPSLVYLWVDVAPRARIADGGDTSFFDDLFNPSPLQGSWFVVDGSTFAGIAVGFAAITFVEGLLWRWRLRHENRGEWQAARQIDSSIVQLLCRCTIGGLDQWLFCYLFAHATAIPLVGKLLLRVASLLLDSTAVVGAAFVAYLPVARVLWGRPAALVTFALRMFIWLVVLLAAAAVRTAAVCASSIWPVEAMLCLSAKSVLMVWIANLFHRGALVRLSSPYSTVMDMVGRKKAPPYRATAFLTVCFHCVDILLVLVAPPSFSPALIAMLAATVRVIGIVAGSAGERLIDRRGGSDEDTL